MATLEQKIKAEHQMRELLRSQDMPQPDVVEYGYTCVRFFFKASMACVVIDIDDPNHPEDPNFDEDVEADLADLDDEEEELEWWLR
jgi:hypothetical protein